MWRGMDRAIQDCRRRAKREPENLQLQEQVDHLNATFPEGRPWGYEKIWTDDWRGFVVAFVAAFALFCVGLYAHRAEGGYAQPRHPAQQIAIHEPAPETGISWPEWLTGIGTFLVGVGGLAALGSRFRKQ